MDQIPDHILIEVFSYFGCSSLKTLMRVCERWSILIKTSKKLTQKFNFVITNSANGLIKIENPLVGGNHSNLVIISKSQQNKSNLEFIKFFKEIIENHKSSLQKVNLHGCNFITQTDVLELKLSLVCDFIKEVEISDCLLNNSENQKELKWKNLRTLRIVKSTADFLQFFENSQLSKLELSSIKNPSSINSKLEKFWKNQTKLKELKITKTEIPFDTLVDLLRRQNLSKLELDIKWISQNSDLIIELAKDCHWSKISFKNGPCREKACMTVKNIIAAYPCIDELEFHKTSFTETDFVISHIYKHLPNIKHLRLPLNFGSIKFNETVKFEELKILEFEGIKYRLSVQKLFKVLEMCKNLKVLRVFWVGHHARVSSDFFEKIFEFAENLEELHIGYKTDTFELSDEFLETIKKNAKSLKKLTTYSENVQELQEKMRIFDEIGIKCVVLKKDYESTAGSKTPKWASMHDDMKRAATCLWKSEK